MALMAVLESDLRDLFAEASQHSLSVKASMLFGAAAVWLAKRLENAGRLFFTISESIICHWKYLIP